jgi:hypothetical protein
MREARVVLKGGKSIRWKSGPKKRLHVVSSRQFEVLAISRFVLDGYLKHTSRNVNITDGLLEFGLQS